MIDTSLDREYEAQKAPADFSTPVPNGRYIAKVVKIEDWKPTKKDIKVIQRDVNGYALKDATGKNITILEKDVTFYNCNVVFEIVDTISTENPEDAKVPMFGRRIYYNVTNHPNMPFVLPQFLDACKKKKLAAKDVQKECLNAKVVIKVGTKTFDKTITDPDTGVERIEPRTYPEVKDLAPYDEPVVQENKEGEDLSLLV